MQSFNTIRDIHLRLNNRLVRREERNRNQCHRRKNHVLIAQIFFRAGGSALARAYDVLLVDTLVDYVPILLQDLSRTGAVGSVGQLLIQAILIEGVSVGGYSEVSSVEVLFEVAAAGPFS